MAEDQLGQRKEWKAPWTKIFSAFKVALDIKKLLLAAAGIVATFVGWWLLAFIFYNMRSMPKAEDYKDAALSDAAFSDFRIARDRWNLLHQLAGPANTTVVVDAGDVTKDWKEYEAIKKAEADPITIAKYGLDRIKPHGLLRTWPGYEDRGYNPYLLVADVIKPTNNEGERTLPWPRGQFLGWFAGNQLTVLLEPLVKFLSPIVYFFDARAGFYNRIYLICVILWTLIVWGYFGGAITRMAAVQVARNEKISMREALRFARTRCQSYISAPIFPLIFLGVLTLFLILFGLVSGLIPILGDVVISGLLWPVVLIIGLIMAVVLVGLVGWPLMNPTISAEGSDSFDALSRSYSYVYQAPWHYLFYSAVALVYGAVLVFFVGLMGSLIVYLGDWGIRQTPFLASSTPGSDREPTYLYVYAPRSFGWRDLLLKSSPYAVPDRPVVVTPSGALAPSVTLSQAYLDSMKPWNYIGAFLVAVWLYLLFFLIVGFGYSFFWTASTIIYLLMRHKVDDTDMDEIHMEEEDTEEPFPMDTPPAAGQTAKPVPAGNVTMVEAPALRTAGAPTAESGLEAKPAGDITPPPPNP